MKIIPSDIMKMNFNCTVEFQKDFKRLSKKFRSLDRDLIEFKKILSEAPLGIGRHFNVIAKIDHVYIIKARFFCQSLKQKSLRVIYSYIEHRQTIAVIGIDFIELYFKGKKANEDRERIKEYLKNFS